MSPTTELKLAGGLVLALLVGVAIVAGVRHIEAAGAAKSEAALSAYQAQAQKDRTAALQKVITDRALTDKRKQEAQDAEYLKRVAAEKDAAAARSGLDGLRRHAAELAAGTRCPAAGAILVSAGPAASAPGDLLADMLGRVGQAAGDIAAFADDAAGAGRLCAAEHAAQVTPQP